MGGALPHPLNISNKPTSSHNFGEDYEKSNIKRIAHQYFITFFSSYVISTLLISYYIITLFVFNGIAYQSFD